MQQTPPPNPAEDLEGFLERQPLSALVHVLVELAQNHEGVQARLARWQLADRPLELAAVFRESLITLCHPAECISYREVNGFASSLEAWLEQVARELEPSDPATALTLFEAFIKSDGLFFENADDSGGHIGDAVHSACRHWLKAASQCDIPISGWQEKLEKLVNEDEYGARDELLRSANLLMDQTELRAMAEHVQARMSKALANAPSDDSPSREARSLSSTLSLLSDALHDPDIKVRAELSIRPQPNESQKLDFAQSYLEAGRPADALTWLQGPWGFDESRRQSLEAKALERLGRYSESLIVRRQLFEQSVSVADLHNWLEHLPPASRSEALTSARQMALAHKDPITAALLLLEMGDDETAESVLLEKQALVRNGSYWTLVPLAEAMRAHQRFRSETLIYRALLSDVLDRGYSAAYHHAARYWARLREIASTYTASLPLESHADFETMIRQKHARKRAFWEHVGGKRD